MSNEDGLVFNMSLQSLKRIDSLLWKISSAALNKDYEQWDTTLKHLRREIVPYLKPKVFEAISLIFEELDELDWLIISNGRKVVVDSKEKQVNKLLDKLTIEIQKALFSCGILMARQEDRGLSVVTT